MSELQNNQSIMPMGGETDPHYLARQNAPGKIDAVFPGSGGKAKKTKKKRNPVAVFFGIIGGIFGALVVAVIVLSLLVTMGELPERTGEPEPVDVSNVAISLFGESEFYLNSGNVDYLLDIVRKSANSSIDQAAPSIPVLKEICIDDLYATLGTSSGNMYSHVKFSVLGIKFTVPVQMKFRVGLEGESAVVYIDYVRCGVVSMPFALIQTIINSGKLPPELSAKNHKIYYDLSTLNDKVREIVREKVAEAIDEQVQGNPILSIIDSLIVDGSLGEAAGEIAANAIDVKIASLGIKDGKLSVTGTVLK